MAILWIIYISLIALGLINFITAMSRLNRFRDSLDTLPDGELVDLWNELFARNPVTSASHARKKMRTEYIVWAIVISMIVIGLIAYAVDWWLNWMV